MRSFWHIARYEYLRHVRRRAFLWTVFGVPLLIAAIMGVVVLVAINSQTNATLGLVDQAGILVAPSNTPNTTPMQTFADENAARAAFDKHEIDSYIVVPDDYLATGAVRAVGRNALSQDAERDVRALLRDSLLQRAPEQNRARLAAPMNLELKTPSSSRAISADSGLLFFLPYAFALVFVLTTFTTSGYLIQALTEEKEDRVIEILATTVQPEQMMAGKIVGLSAVGATQMLVWLGTPALVVAIIAPGVFTSGTDGIGWTVPLLATVYFLLGFLLIATCYATIGAAVTSPQEAQAFVGPISLLAVSPLFLVTVILARPNGVPALILSLIPFSSPMTMLMRLPIADIPVWQIILTLVMLVLSTLGALWLSARVMRLGMLRFSQRLRLGEIFRRGT